MDGRVKVVGQVERVDGRSLTYAEFVDRFMEPNRPVVLTGLTGSWRSSEDWTLPDPADCGRPNLGFFARNFPSPLVPVAVCSSREFTDQKRLEMSMPEFIDHWIRNTEDHDSSLLYLKDWHFVKEYPDYVAYTTPTFFVDDWLNMYLDSHPIHRDSDIANHKNEVNCADYRNMRSSVYNLNDDVSEKHFPEFHKTEWLECIQEQNEVIFVPSGWYHQVHNLEDTISINHNWFNAYNLHWVWNLLYDDYKVAREYIEDIRDICDDFEGLCQRNLAANTGMNFYDFFIFIVRFTLANAIELCHIQQLEDTVIPTETAHHLVYNLTSIRNVASKMIGTDAFCTDNLLHISDDNHTAFSNIKEILEEDSFRRLLMTLSETYEHIGRAERICFNTRVSSQMGCLSLSCLKSDCNVVDHICTCEVHGPEDLVRLIDNVLLDK
ncbi:hypothetical protein PR202_ga10821 [Eleusine coracana subsp. coracana]|uniref:JmjC domain-containing protein n=1 Tax=Eleusine coracana subsp. coracana TaxID=191504 RepID=A0AAV5C7P9_ELECO|nr:hypothetical protein PR202_ga10821 [Eleusine coracana subsp. coracana]